MAETVRLLDPAVVDANKENPRLIFREDELQALEESIASQGILVPLTVFADGSKFTLLDGERRWRCALKLALKTVPVIVQPKPNKLQNIMMMFAIHKARSDWDPLPTAQKLRELENELARRRGREPTEDELAAAASLSRGEVRRYRRILALPEHYKKELMLELAKPRQEQVLTVDLVLETTKGSEALEKYKIISQAEKKELDTAIIDKFRNKIVRSTVAPRKLVRLARAVQRKEIPKGNARIVVRRLISHRDYSIDQAFNDSIEQLDFEHSLEQLASRIMEKLKEHKEKGYAPGYKLKVVLAALRKELDRLLK